MSTDTSDTSTGGTAADRADATSAQRTDNGTGILPGRVIEAE
ncbi:hypothetical protein ACFQ0M_19280 [Kitasatospora aburaviensis]